MRQSEILDLTQAEQAVAEVELAIQQRFSPHEPHPASVAIEPV
ncbi:MAG: hypothetical protein OEU26_32125 [Candidatus Tectomicrobia bacterium]|nr:hypothetical protein [Candidatus Tectomicrobia bacterium]